MHIYIDEAGTFTTFRESRSSISCVAALVVPESVHDGLLVEFQKLIRSWGFGSNEVKGRLLSELHIDESIRAVYNTQRAFLRIAAIDMGLHTGRWGRVLYFDVAPFLKQDSVEFSFNLIASLANGGRTLVNGPRPRRRRANVSLDG